MRFGKIIGLITLVGMLGACGYKADLYLAKDKPAAKPASEQNSDETKQKESKTDGTRG